MIWPTDCSPELNNTDSVNTNYRTKKNIRSLVVSDDDEVDIEEDIDQTNENLVTMARTNYFFMRKHFRSDYHPVSEIFRIFIKLLLELTTRGS
jgi:hypothetical protein